MSEPPAAQFYTGLVSELYEELLSRRSEPDDYAPFLAANEAPFLELGCGSGLPMLELCRRGFAVEGVDSSADMLARCRARALSMGLDVTLHQQEMQALDLPRRYGAIFLAGATFTVLDSDEDARRTLDGMFAHLDPGGGVLIPLEVIPPEEARQALGNVAEKTGPEGHQLRVSTVEVSVDVAARRLCRRLRYERIAPDGRSECVERDFRTLWWEPSRFGQMLLDAGFETPTAVLPTGGRAAEDSRVFVFLARRPR